jgi:DNA-directed RNA polymerase specialized sigma subunit
MTIKELSQLHWLYQEIEDTRKSIEGVENLLPVGMCPSDAEQFAIEIAELRRIMEERLEKCDNERERLEEYIAAVPDENTRLLMVLRFAEGLSWADVAYSLGDGTLPGSVRKRVHRYVNKG